MGDRGTGVMNQRGKVRKKVKVAVPATREYGLRIPSVRSGDLQSTFECRRVVVWIDRRHWRSGRFMQFIMRFPKVKAQRSSLGDMRSPELPWQRQHRNLCNLATRNLKLLPSQGHVR